MTNNTTAASTYVVRLVVEVDRPALRGNSFAAVPAGTRMTQTIEHKRQGSAVREMGAVLAGAYDYSSEYVVKVEVYERRPNGAIVRTVRRQVERTDVTARRRATSVVADRQLRRIAMAVAAERNGNTWRNLAA